MSLDENWRQIKIVIWVVVLSTVALGAFSLFAFISQHASANRDHTLVVGIKVNGDLTVQGSDRTECIRKIQAAVEDRRWDLVGQGFHSANRADAARIGTAISNLPQPYDLADTGGKVGEKYFAKCPLPPKAAKGDKPATVETTQP